MHKRGTGCRPESVRLTHYCKRLKIIVKLLSRQVAPNTSFVDYQASLPILRQTPSAGALNTRKWENMRFSNEIAFYLGNGRGYDIGCYGSDGQPIDPCQFQ